MHPCPPPPILLHVLFCFLRSPVPNACAVLVPCLCPELVHGLSSHCVVYNAGDKSIMASERASVTAGLHALGPTPGLNRSLSGWAGQHRTVPLAQPWVAGVDIIVTTLPRWGWGVGGGLLSQEAVMTE